MKKILIIDDNPELLSMYATIFASEKFMVIECNDPKHALSKAVKEKPDIILIDIMMPGINGFDMIQKLRTTQETKQTPIIAMSNLPEQEVADTAIRQGATKFLLKSKVSDPKFLLQEVHNIL